MRKRLILVSLVYFSGCAFHGAIRNDFYTGQREMGQKIPASVAIDTSAEIPPIRAAGGLGDKYSIDVHDGLYDALTKALKSTFENVVPVSEVTREAPVDYIAIPAFEAKATRQDSLTGDTTFDTSLSLDFRDFKSQKEVAQYGKSGQILYQNPGSVQTLSFLTGFSLFILSPVTIPAMTQIAGQHGVELAEENIGRYVKAITQDIQNDANNFSTKNWERGPVTTPNAVMPEAAPLKPTSLRSDVDTPTYKTTAKLHDFAVIIGIEKYHNLPDAAFAERDAETMRSHLIAMGYPERNIVTLLGADATRSAFTTNLETWLANNVDGESTVFVYYSGHGAPDQDGQAYLVPWDGNPAYLKDSAYSLKSVYESLAKLPAKRVLVALDACFSGAGGRSVLAKGARPLVTQVKFSTFISDNIVTLAAAGPNQISGIYEDEGHGLFTYYFLRGLNGAAKNDTGKITAQSLYDYLSPNVQDSAHRSNRDQKPALLGAPGQAAEFVLR